jgi:hypothetical protein
MTVSRGRLNWGVFFIVLGAVPLALHMGAFSTDQVAGAWRLWPLIIVGIGAGFVLSRTPAHFVGGLIVAATMGLVLGSLFAVGPRLGCGNGDRSGHSIARSGSFDGSAQVSLSIQCGTATVTNSTDAQWHLTAYNSSGDDPNVSAGGNRLSISSDGSGSHWFDQGKDTWEIALPSGNTISLEASLDMGDSTFNLSGTNVSSASFNLNLGSLHVDLTGSKVNQLSVETNLGSAELILDGDSDVTGNLKTNLGSLEVCAPPGLGLQITASDSLGSTELSGMGLTRNGNVWTSSDYATAAHRANLTVDTSLGSMRLHGLGGCK